MLGKFLEKRIEVLPDENVIGADNPIELEYYLLESEILDLDELTGMKVYGMEIVKKINNVKIECKAINNFSCCKEDTQKIINKLANNTVTPVTLSYILDDMIGA